MTIYPDIQSRAQDELDRAIGRDRLPTFEDKEDLPYIERIVWECLRWNPGAYRLFVCIACRT